MGLVQECTLVGVNMMGCRHVSALSVSDCFPLKGSQFQKEPSSAGQMRKIFTKKREVTLPKRAVKYVIDCIQLRAIGFLMMEELGYGAGAGKWW